MPSIYGDDETGFANSIASKAVQPPSEDRNCGAPEGAEVTKGNRPYDKGDVIHSHRGEGMDDRACTAGNHGKQGCND
jgi:hypothetical protein